MGQPRFLCVLALVGLALSNGSCADADAERLAAQDAETRREMRPLRAELIREIEAFGGRARAAFAEDETMSRAVTLHWGQPAEDLHDPFGTFAELSVGVVQMNQSMVEARFAALLAAATNHDLGDEYGALWATRSQATITRIFGEMIAAMGRYRQAHEP